MIPVFNTFPGYVSTNFVAEKYFFEVVKKKIFDEIMESIPLFVYFLSPQISCIVEAPLLILKFCNLNNYFQRKILERCHRGTRFCNIKINNAF